MAEQDGSDGRGPDGRVTEIGGWERIDDRPHPLAAAIAMGLLVVVFAVALVGLGVAIERGDRRVEVADIEVPSIVGLTEEAARALLEESGLIMEVSESPNEFVEFARVFDQEPIAGAKLEVGSPVTAAVSTGPAGTIVPDTVGQQASDALTLLQTVGLSGEVASVPDELVRPGEVLGSDPLAGRRAPADKVVRLQVSSGPAPRVVPAIEGRDSLEVLAELGRLRLLPGDITRRSGSDQPDGTVLSIDPAAGSEVARGSTVDLVVAGSEPGPEMPSVVGLLQATATDAAAESGVSVAFRRVDLPTGDSRDGRVIRQGLPAGTEVPEGLVVEVVVGIALPPPTTVPAPDATATTTTRPR